MRHDTELERTEALTWAETIEKKGRDEGIREGIRAGSARTLATQLAKRFGPVSTVVSERLAAASEQELEAWALRVLDATSLRGVFADDP